MVNMELKNLKGKCLLAMPNVQDRFFRSALVLVTSVDDFHVRGLIVNKPSDQLVSDILNQMNIDIGLGFEDQRILHGGPVRRDRLYFLKRAGGLAVNCKLTGNEIYRLCGGM